MTDVMQKSITFAGFEIKDEAKGEVEAKIATLEVIDKDGDIIRKGALPKGAKAAMSRWGHDSMFGERPIGKGPLTEHNGQLVFTGKMFLKTVEGRETFETLKEMGPDQEWSFGFRIKGWENPSDEERKAGAYRIITKMEPISEAMFEVSPVLAGAGIATQTTGIKGQQPAFTDAQRAELKAMIDEAVAAATVQAAEVTPAPEPAPETVPAVVDEAAIVEAARVEAEQKAAELDAATKELDRFRRTMQKVA